MSDYKMDVEVAVSGDGEARDRLKTLEKYIEQIRTRAAALNRLRISPAVAIDDRISSPLRSVRAELERAGNMYLKVFSNAGTGMTESIKPVFDSITDWFDFCRTKVDWWKSSLIQAGREAAENVLSEFQRAYARIRKMFLENLNLQLDVTGKLLVEHKVIAFINNLNAVGSSSATGNTGGSVSEKKGFVETAGDTFADKLISKGISKAVDGLMGIIGKTSIGKKIDKALNVLPKPVREVLTESAKETVSELGTDKAKDLYNLDKETAPKAWETVKGFASSLDDKKIGNKSVNQIGSGILDYGKELAKGITDDGAGGLLKTAKKALKSVPRIGEVVGLIDIANSEDKVKTVAEAAGGMGGAAMGAAIGTMFFPGAGTLVGGALGLIGGFIGEKFTGKAVDSFRNKDQNTENFLPGQPVSNRQEGSNAAGINQNLTINVTVDSDMDRVELAQFVAERIAAEVRKITQNTTPAYCACGT